MLPEALAGTARAGELALLVAAARNALVAECAADVAAAAAAGLDWGFVVRAAHGHGVVPLLHRALTAHARGAVPPAALSALAERRAAAARHNLQLTATLLPLLDALAARGIAAIPFKGPLLALALYGDVAMRPFADLDILVRRRDALAGVGALEELGFRLATPMRPRRRQAHLRCAWVWDFTLRRGPVAVELHWRLTAPFFGLADELDELEPALVTAALAGSPVRTLPATELLLYLCIHGATHRWARLEWICDVAALLRDRTIDWSRLRHGAQARGAERMLDLGVFLARDLLRAHLPAGALAAGAGERRARALARHVYRRLPDERPDPSPGLALLPFHLAMRERLRDRARYVAALAFAPSQLDLDAVALPPRLFGLYYLLRPPRLVISRVSALLHAVARRGGNRGNAVSD